MAKLDAEEIRLAVVFCERMREARERRGYTQAHLAERMGVQSSTVSHFETGGRRPSMHNLRRLAMALNVSADYLLGITML